jgi:hypothetical protein
MSFKKSPFFKGGLFPIHGFKGAGGDFAVEGR